MTVVTREWWTITSWIVALCAGGFAIWQRVSIPPATLLPAAALMTATLMALVTISFNRLKDAVAVPRAEGGGSDPAYDSYVLFKRACASALLALAIAGLCVVGIFTVAKWPCSGPWFSGCILGAVVILGAELSRIVSSLRTQAEELIGDRAIRPDRDRSAFLDK